MAGLRYLAAQHIIHGDIKPHNLLVGEDGVVKIADFGLSTKLFQQKLVSAGGTPLFMAPEVCSGEEHSGFPSDVWALGVTIFLLATGRPPFVASGNAQLFMKIMEDPLDTTGINLSPPLQEVLH